MDPIILFLVPIAFICEFIDSTLGMGYGTSLTPLLLLMGYEPLQIIPAVLFSEFISGIMAGILHGRSGNADFDFSNDTDNYLVQRLGDLGYVPKSRDSKIAFLLVFCSILGTVAAVLVAVNVSSLVLKSFIGTIVLSMGIVILWRKNKKFSFTWKKILGIGLLASFNKGLSGGGYGPLVTGGQILSGTKAKSAVAITSLAEGLTCFVGIIAYYLSKATIDWMLAPYLALGAIASVPFSVKAVKKINEDRITLLIGGLSVFLGLLTLYKAYA